MKKMTCKQLGGACDVVFTAETFEEMAALSKEHGKAMFQANDQPHLDAMEQMQALMQEPDSMKKWFEEKRRLFDSLDEI